MRPRRQRRHRLVAFFRHDELPENLKHPAVEFAQLAAQIDRWIENSPEKDRALQLLLEAKNVAIQAQIHPELVEVHDDDDGVIACLCMIPNPGRRMAGGIHQCVDCGGLL